MKAQRHMKIRQIIRGRPIETPEQLANELKARGL